MSILASRDESRVSVPREEPDTWYFPVSVLKFIGMSVVTFGLYELYWFYRNWRFVGELGGREVSPLARAFFAPLFYYALLDDIDSRRPHASALKAWSPVLALAYIAVHFAERLPEPYLLAAFLTFLPLLPAVMAINALNDPGRSDLVKNSRWMPRHLPLAFVGVFILHTALASINLLPSTQVVEGSRLWARDVRFLQAEQLLEEGEEVLYFYSLGMLSIHADGQFLTDRRVVSYEKDFFTGQVVGYEAALDEIVDVEVFRAANWLEVTRVRIILEGGEWFALFLSAEAGADEVFIGELEARRRRAQTVAVTKSSSST